MHRYSCICVDNLQKDNGNADSHDSSFHTDASLDMLQSPSIEGGYQWVTSFDELCCFNVGNYEDHEHCKRAKKLGDDGLLDPEDTVNRLLALSSITTLDNMTPEEKAAIKKEYLRFGQLPELTRQNIRKLEQSIMTGEVFQPDQNTTAEELSHNTILSMIFLHHSSIPYPKCKQSELDFIVKSVSTFLEPMFPAIEPINVRWYLSEYALYS